MSGRHYIAEGAVVRGDVTLGEDTSVWFHATVRGDNAPIAIGGQTNIQDNAVVHVEMTHPTLIGTGVTIGHSAIVHGCTIGDNTLIGMGSIIMNGASIGKNCVIGAGALVTQNMVIPDGSLAFGNPAKVIREVTPEELEGNRKNALRYVAEAKEQLEEYL